MLVPFFRAAAQAPHQPDVAMEFHDVLAASAVVQTINVLRYQDEAS